MLRLRSVSLGLLCVALTSTVHAQEDRSLSTQDVGAEARARFQLGAALYDQARFPEAAEEFDAAYAISNHPAALYNSFVCFRDALDTENAVQRLERYLATGAAEGAEERRLRQTLENLRAALSEAEDRTAPPSEDDPEVEPTPAPEPSPVPDQTSASFPLLPVLTMSLGGALLVAGAVTGILTIMKDSDVSDACAMGCTNPEDDVSEGERLALATDILLIGGAVIAGAGLLWFFLSGGDEEPDASVSCGVGGCAVHSRF
ncbi:MAG: hypothetical protein AAGF12_06825 [Myxococcota bacterium]